MRKFFFLTILLFNPALATQTLNDIQTWTDAKLHTTAVLTQISELITEERPIPVQKIAEGDRNFGYSFHGVTEIQQDCLKTIRSLVCHGHKPLVYDLGAGHGLMTWKMLVAGGCVCAVENQRIVMEALQNATLKAVPFIAPETIEQSCRVLCGDVLRPKTFEVLKTPCDVSWSGNLLHFFTPEQAKVYLKNLYEATNPGGLAFASVNTPSNSSEVVEFYEKQKQAGVEFPGHMLLNRCVYAVSGGSAFDETEKLLFLGYSKAQPHDLPGSTIAAAKCIKITHVGYPRTQDCLGREFSVVKHYIGLPVLRMLFEQAGFIVEDAYYLDDMTGKRVTQELTSVDKAQHFYNAGIKARKPVKLML